MAKFVLREEANALRQRIVSLEEQQRQSQARRKRLEAKIERLVMEVYYSGKPLGLARAKNILRRMSKL